MTIFQQRLFVALDEWIGAALLLYLHRAHDEAFWPVLVFWAICTYAIAYPLLWRRERAASRIERRLFIARIRGGQRRDELEERRREKQHAQRS